MPRNKTNEIIVVLGQSGSGKSSWVQKYVPSISRFILWDTLNEYDFNEVRDIESLLHAVYRANQGAFQLRYVSEDDGDGEIEQFSEVCRICLAVENCFLIVEEVDQYATPNEIPFNFRRVIKFGRHYGVSTIAVSQRPAMINRLITSQSRHVIAFQMTEPNDVRYMRSKIGPAADELTTLPQLHYIEWHHENQKIERGVISWEK